MQLELGLAVGQVPREGDENQNHTEYDNLGLGMIQLYSLHLNEGGVWRLVSLTCVEINISQCC